MKFGRFILKTVLRNTAIPKQPSGIDGSEEYGYGTAVMRNQALSTMANLVFMAMRAQEY